MDAGNRAPRIGLIGCGNWGRHVLRDLVACGCEVAVVAVSPDSVANARAGCATRIVSHIADLGETDGVIVVTPALTHVAVIEEVLARWPGLPIYTEKPLTVDPDVADRMAAACAAHLFVMHKWRYHPGVLALADIARDGTLGGVVGLRLTREQWGFPSRDVDAIWTHLPHVLSIVLEVFGSIPEPQWARFDRAAGGIVGMTGALGTHPWVAIHDSTRGFQIRREVQLYCEHGVARLGDSYADAIEILRASGGGHPERQAVSTKLPLLSQVEAFLEFVRGSGAPPKGSAAEDAAIVRTILSLRRLAGE
jgi:predicted dehydrogenase